MSINYIFLCGCCRYNLFTIILLILFKYNAGKSSSAAAVRNLTIICIIMSKYFRLSVKNRKPRRLSFKFINKKFKNIYNISDFILWAIFFFSIIPLTKASVVDKGYKSYQDVYDGILNALFPIFFVILFQINNSSTTKNLPDRYLCSKFVTQRVLSQRMPSSPAYSRNWRRGRLSAA